MNSGSWVKGTLAVNSASSGMDVSSVTIIADASRLSVARQAFCGVLRGLSVREFRFVIETLLQGLFAGLLLHLVTDGLRFLVVTNVAVAFPVVTFLQVAVSLPLSSVVCLVSHRGLLLLVGESRYFFALPDVEVDENISERWFGIEDLVQRVHPSFLPFGERAVFGYDMPEFP